MKLSLTPDEFAGRLKISRFGEKRLEEFRTLIATRIPIALSPVLSDGSRRIAVVVPSELAKAGTTMHSISFVPVWARCFLVCNKGGEINSITAEFEHGQFSFTREDEQPTQFTTHGPGVGEEAERKAEVMLSRLITSESSDPIVRKLLRYVWEHFSEEKAVAA